LFDGVLPRSDNQGAIILDRGTPSSTTEINLGIHPDGSGRLFSALSSQNLPSPPNPIAFHQFAHVVLTWDGSRLKYFTDGNLNGDFPVTLGVPQSSPRSIRIARSIQSSSDSAFKGIIDEVRIYDRALSADEILQLATRDSDGDGVADNLDQCPNTPAGSIVDARGCSIAQLVTCDGQWKNHGQYVSAVAKMCEQFLSAGLITEDQKDAIVEAAAGSNCGKK